MLGAVKRYTLYILFIGLIERTKLTYTSPDVNLNSRIIDKFA